MREIKFRAWYRDAGKMCSVESLQFAPNATNILVTDKSGAHYLLDADEAKIMQYTGLYDYAGTEIYEGDVLRGELGSLYEVEFNDGQFQPVLRYGGTQVVIESIADMAEYSSVVGNIYENPELLEARDEQK